MKREVVTIGVYGFTEQTFLCNLRDAGVTTLCDVRLRRGMRGKAYSFANSTALQRSLKEMGVAYLHRKDLAPSKETRAIQKHVDASAKILKRERTALSSQFVSRYEDENLSSFDAVAFLSECLPGTIGLLCVETNPTACHRFLIADHLARTAMVGVRHLCPSAL